VTAPAGRDRRLVRYRAPDGVPHARELSRRPRAVVAGGGIAGLAAAAGLAERGVAVTLIEREHYLGGRAGSWTDTLADGTEVTMSRGFHAFFRQYYNLRALLRRADPGLCRLTPLADYPLVGADGRVDSFRGLPRTPPWNALAFALRSPTFRARDLLALDARAAAPLAAVSVPAVYRRLDDIDAGTFLRRVNFPPAARHLALEVFSRSFFASPERLSAAELATMFHIYFLGSAEGLLFDVPEASYDAALWAPLRGYLAGRGVTVLTGTRVTAVAPGQDRTWSVRLDGGALLLADAVVLATDIAGLQRIVGASPGLDDRPWRGRIAAMRCAPPFLVYRLWLDRPLAARRPAFLATGGLAPLDNVSVLERYEREAAAWAARTHGSVVELHAYAADGGDPAELRPRLVRRLHGLYPESARARIVAESAQWRRDCPLFAPGSFARRPHVRTPFGGLVLAGDGIRIDLPVALMERAASTGWHAANCLLAGWGLAGHSLCTVPNRGRLAPLRWLASREGANRP